MGLSGWSNHLIHFGSLHLFSTEPGLLTGGNHSVGGVTACLSFDLGYGQAWRVDRAWSSISQRGQPAMERAFHRRCVSWWRDEVEREDGARL